MDLISDFAFRLPVIVICDMLGIPEEDREIFFHARAHRRAAARSGAADARRDRRGQPGPSRNSVDYFQRLFELRRREPGDDLTTQLVHAEEDGNKLTNEELFGNIMLLFGAGHETTVNLIGNGLLALHRNPDQLALLKSRPELMPNAIEEFLRYDSSVQTTGRVALEDIGEIGGKQIKKGDAVLCLLGSANRDPAAYPDTGQARHHPAEHPRPLRSAAASTSASAHSWRASRPRSPFRRCCGGCRT